MEEYHNFLPSVSDCGAWENKSSIFRAELRVIPREKAMLPASLGTWVSINLLTARRHAIPRTKWLLLISSAISASLRILLNFSKMFQVFWTVSLSRERSVFGGLGFHPSVRCGQVRKAASPFLLVSASLAWSRSKLNLLLLQLHVFKQLEVHLSLQLINRLH